MIKCQPGGWRALKKAKLPRQEGFREGESGILQRREAHPSSFFCSLGIISGRDILRTRCRDYAPSLISPGRPPLSGGWGSRGLCSLSGKYFITCCSFPDQDIGTFCVNAQKNLPVTHLLCNILTSNTKLLLSTLVLDLQSWPWNCLTLIHHYLFFSYHFASKSCDLRFSPLNQNCSKDF